MIPERIEVPLLTIADQEQPIVFRQKLDATDNPFECSTAKCSINDLSPASNTWNKSPPEESDDSGNSVRTHASKGMPDTLRTSSAETALSPNPCDSNATFQPFAEVSAASQSVPSRSKIRLSYLIMPLA